MLYLGESSEGPTGDLKISLSKPSSCTAALSPSKSEAWGALSHPIVLPVGAFSSSETEMSGPPGGAGRGVGVQGEARGTAAFPSVVV